MDVTGFNYFTGIFFLFFSLKNSCAKTPCKNNATCQAGFTDRDYQCLCILGVTGHDCGEGKGHQLY